MEIDDVELPEVNMDGCPKREASMGVGTPKPQEGEEGTTSGVLIPMSTSPASTADQLLEERRRLAANAGRLTGVSTWTMPLSPKEQARRARYSNVDLLLAQMTPDERAEINDPQILAPPKVEKEPRLSAYRAWRAPPK